MPNKHHENRRHALRELLTTGPAATQASLVRALEAQGIPATQSSVSRDLKELGAIKTAGGYSLAAGPVDADADLAAVRNLLRSRQPAGPNLLVIHTAIGAAQRVALAFDRSHWPGIVGTIAGDDTIFIATETASAQKNLAAMIDRATRA